MTDEYRAAVASYVAARADEQVQRVGADIVAPLTDRRVRQLADLLERLIEGLDEEEPP